jgi:tRNA pseudouridine55 synthase
MKLDGVIVVDKPEGWTSHDVVGKMRRIANTRRIGHLGTLDPIATGVLPLVIERATRLAQFYTRADKVYEGVVCFGWSTDTYDREGSPTSEQVAVEVDREALEEALGAFRGKLLQTPPAVSAKRIGGKRAYQLARAEAEQELKPAAVEVFELTVVAVDSPYVRLRAHCSGGTYLRTIAHDLGKKLGPGAHLHELRRLQSGEFEISQARTIAQLEELAAEQRLTEALVPAARLLPAFPVVPVDDAMVTQIRHGRNFPASPFRSQTGSKHVKAIARGGELVAIGEAVLPNLYHPVVVL